MDHSYTMTQWQDAPSTETPLSADNLNHIEQGIGAIYHDVGVLEESLNTFIVADLLPIETHNSGEGSYTSAQDYSADDLMIIGTKIYKALSGIETGDTIILPDSGSTPNVSEISLGEAIIKLAANGGGDSPDISGLVTRINTVESSVSDIVQNELPILRIRINALENAVATRSHVGQIIQSTTLDTMEKVIGVYGGATWIQHDGYMLRGASSDVTPNSAVADGGEETVTLTVNEMPSHTHIQNSHNHAQNAHSHTMTNKYTAKQLANGSNSPRFRSDGSTSATNFTYCGATTATNNPATATNQYTGGGQAHNNMPPYKNVYIWERTA